MMENTWPKGARGALEDALHRGNVVGHAAEVTGKAVGDERLYFCVIDRLCYGNLDTALVHVKMQHGMAIHGELLLRAKMIGGSP